jgi:hypothetical protein
MPRAMLKDGVIYPLEPLPTEWRDGQELRVERADFVAASEESAAEIDRDFAELAALCAVADPAEDERFGQALDEAKQLAKEEVRRQMELR